MGLLWRCWKIVVREYLKHDGEKPMKYSYTWLRSLIPGKLLQPDEPFHNLGLFKSVTRLYWASLNSPISWSWGSKNRERVRREEAGPQPWFLVFIKETTLDRADFITLQLIMFATQKGREYGPPDEPFHKLGKGSSGDNPTDPFTISELQNPSNHVPEQHQIRWSMDFKAQTFWKGSSTSFFFVAFFVSCCPCNCLARTGWAHSTDHESSG